MGDEIFSVYLTPADYSKLAYAKLDLPASPWKLLDALDKVRLPEGDSLYLEITDYTLFCGTAKPGSGCLCKAITSEFLCNASKIDQVARHISLRKPMNSLAILAVV